MSTSSQTNKKSFASKLRRLSKRVDTKVVDDILDEILHQIAELKSVSCALAEEGSGLCLRSQDGSVAEVALPRAKTVLRLLCARLAVRSAEWAGREVSLYGDDGELQLPNLRRPCTV